MPHQQLMSTLVGDDCFEREILRVRVSFECLAVNSQQVVRNGCSAAVLRAAAVEPDLARLIEGVGLLEGGA